MSLGWLIHTWASMIFFSAFHYEENKAPPTFWGALLHIYSVVCLYGCNVRRAFVEKYVSSHRHFLYTATNTQRVRKPSLSWFCAEKTDSPRKQYPQLSISDVKILLLVEKIGKACQIHNVFCLHDGRDSRLFSNLEPDVQPKLAHAYYVFPLWNY